MDVNSKEAADWTERMKLKSENEALRAVVNDMIAGLQYLRITNSVPYGFGIDRLEQTGHAALGNADRTDSSNMRSAQEE
jgi:hypothetical protein